MQYENARNNTQVLEIKNYKSYIESGRKLTFKKTTDILRRENKLTKEFSEEEVNEFKQMRYTMM